MIPFFQQPTFAFGPLTIHAFGLIVALAVLVGLRIGASRFARSGLDPAIGERLAWWAIVGGFIGAHLFSVIFYFPEKIAKDPLVLLRFWEDISSFGSILGGLVGIWLFLRIQAPEMPSERRWAYLDGAAFAFTVSLMTGRIACSLAHDHPGKYTRFPLALSLKSEEARAYLGRVYAAAGRTVDLPPQAELARYGFHDLGLYEFLYLALIVVPAMSWLDRQPRRLGFFVVAFVTLYVPVRFLLDFLRVSDIRYGPFTPAQWVALASLASLPLLIANVRRQPRWNPTNTYSSTGAGTPPSGEGGSSATAIYRRLADDSEVDI